jgi:hypothetical protein
VLSLCTAQRAGIQEVILACVHSGISMLWEFGLGNMPLRTCSHFISYIHSFVPVNYLMYYIYDSSTVSLELDTIFNCRRNRNKQFTNG